MLRSLKDLEQYAVNATDGDVGHVVDFLVEDERWTIRYLVVETGSFFDRRRVLISPVSFGKVEWSSRRVDLALSKEKVKNSPAIDARQPVSRRREFELFRYYGVPHYWGSSALWGETDYPAMLGVGEFYSEAAAPLELAHDDIHLRSVNEISGYHIQGSDGELGHLDDFIVDDGTWQLRYLVVDTSNWCIGKKVLLAPHWASSVSWAERKVYVDQKRQSIKHAPEWNSLAVNRDYEERLYQYHGRRVYWRD